MKSAIKKIEVVNILFSIFNAENDAPWNLTLAAMNAVMNELHLSFKGGYEIEEIEDSEIADKYEFWLNHVFPDMEGFALGAGFFEYLVNDSACDIDRFAEACDVCIDFSLLETYNILNTIAA